MRSIRRHKHAMGALLVDYRHKDDRPTAEDFFERAITASKYDSSNLT